MPGGIPEGIPEEIPRRIPEAALGKTLQESHTFNHTTHNHLDSVEFLLHVVTNRNFIGIPQ